eukprot:CAMPEP_0184484156 /NCGR_PEP_ID=MMETSP0113_2-20130426/5861_1 /TAXON_ID=91329 /ORGANISM="Norrisiella sphaerica, Strain BC52" /LENGTH=360 /DNA_ID=CAMNT_0026864997 /DNA_START=36 /DNA_END=1118 /DNA_ORIENTATION=+
MAHHTAVLASIAANLLLAAVLLFQISASGGSLSSRAVARAGIRGARSVQNTHVLASSGVRRPFNSMFSQSQRTVLSRAEKKDEEPQGHQDGRPKREPTEKEKRIMEYQQNAPKLSFSEEARSLVEYGNGYAVISTVHPDGYPGGAVVMYAPDEDGLPIFSFSTMSSHTQDLLKNSKASVTIQTNDFKGAADARVNLAGDIEQVKDEEAQKYKDAFIKKHPNAFWVSFGDFLIFRMTSIKHIRFVGGFARAANISPEDYLKASPDPVMQFADKIAGHMNEDHSEATKAIVAHQMGLECETAEIKTVDRLGMTVFVSVKQEDGSTSTPFKLRVGFPEEAPDRVGVRNMLKRMTNEAAEALSA